MIVRQREEIICKIGRIYFCGVSGDANFAALVRREAGVLSPAQTHPQNFERSCARRELRSDRSACSLLPACRLERSRCGGGRFRVRLSQLLRLIGVVWDAEKEDSL